jgi:putative transposase
VDILAPDAWATAARALAPRADPATRQGENPHWGYKRIVGELKGLGVAVSASSVRKVLLEAGLRPAQQRTHSSWRAFLRAQAGSMLACDFLTVETIFSQRTYVLFFISLATRRIEHVACTPNPDGGWVTQQARNLIMQLGDEQPFRLLVHDRDRNFSHTFDEVFRTEGITVIKRPSKRPTRTLTPSAGSALSALIVSTES